MINAVIDTNVLVAAMRSRSGASFRIVELALQGVFRLHCSVPLCMEYEEILTRSTNLPADARSIFLSALLSRINQHEIYFLFRGVLPDDDDAMILELAIKSQSVIVTHNTKRFYVSKELWNRCTRTTYFSPPPATNIMTITIDIPNTMYRHLLRIAEEEYGNSSVETLSVLLQENWNDVLSQSLQKRYAKRNANTDEALQILHGYAGDEEPQESDRIIQPSTKH